MPDASPQISLTLVLGIAGILFSWASLIIQGLAKLAWKSREEVIRQGNDAAKLMADKAMSNTVDILKQLQSQKDETARVDTTVRLLQADHLRAAKDLADVQAKMVTREVFESKMSEQTSTLKSTIEAAVRNGGHPARGYPSSDQVPAVRLPPRSRPGSE